MSMNIGKPNYVEADYFREPELFLLFSVSFNRKQRALSYTSMVHVSKYELMLHKVPVTFDLQNKTN